MKAKPYIGVTGPINAIEVESILESFAKNGVDMHSSHIPMIGYLASFKTLNDWPTDNKRYPKIKYINFLARWAKDRALTMVHYNSQEMSTLAGQVEKIFGGMYDEDICRAIQLNIVWPDVAQVNIIKKRFPEMKIVFQASHKAMDGKSDLDIVSGIKKYGSSIDYVLIDPSGGRGLEFDIDSSVKLYEQMSAKIPNITVGIAGGFRGDNVEERISRIIETTGRKDFCIDAEGGIRDKLSEIYGDDLFNEEKIKAYVDNVCRALQKMR